MGLSGVRSSRIRRLLQPFLLRLDDVDHHLAERAVKLAGAERVNAPGYA